MLTFVAMPRGEAWPLLLCASLWSQPDTASLLRRACEDAAPCRRLDRPWNVFLLDGRNAQGAGDLFYAEHRFSSAERFSPLPDLEAMPAFPVDTARTALGLDFGNEAGDPMLRELIGEGAGGNRTPFTRGFLRAAPHASLRLALEGEQNDHSSYRTFPRRVEALGGRPWSEMSYIGENLPPLSLARGGAELNRRGGTLRLAHARGTAWGRSALTGESYPLEVEGTEVQAGADEDLLMRFRYIGYEGASRLDRFSPDASLSEVGLRVGGHGADWRWALAWAYRKRLVERGSALSPLERGSYPWDLRLGKGWKGDDFPWKAGVRAAVEYDEGVFLNRLFLEAEEPLRKKHVFRQALRAYHRRPVDDSAFVAETAEGLAERSGFDLPRNGRGAGFTAGYAYRDSLWEAGLSGSGTWEWGVPVFAGRTLSADPAPEFWNSRVGSYRGAGHVLQRSQAEASAKAKLGLARLRAAAGWQAFFGEEAASLEFSPSPVYAEGEARFAFARGLAAEARLQGLGPKRYRGYGVDKRVPPHAENHLGLEQSLFGRRALARLVLFHAFGEEVLEHPLGNPIRFRVLAGLEARLP